MQAIGSPVDFVGINIYGPAAYVRAARSYVAAPPRGGLRRVPSRRSFRI